MTAASRPRLGILQRVLPTYRAPLFDLLAGEHGFEVEVFAGQPQRGEGISQSDGMTYARLKSTTNVQVSLGFARFFWQRGIPRWLDEFKPAILVADINPWMVSTRLALRWMHRSGRPVIGWGLGVLPSEGFAGTVKRIAYRRALARFDGLIAYGTKAAEDFIALGFDRSKVSVAFNAASVASAAGPPPTIAGTVAGTPSVVFVGRLTREKRVDQLIEAMALLDQRARLVIVGDGPDYARLSALAQSSPVEIEFAGRQAGDRLAGYLDQATLFVLPAAGGLAIQEAMSHGLPVVASFADGTERDLVRDGQNGFLVTPGDVFGLASAIERVVSNEAVRDQFGKESRRIVEEEINLDIMARQFADAVRRTLDTSEHRA